MARSLGPVGCTCDNSCVLPRERLQIKERKKSNKERKRQKKERERLAEDSCINKKTMKSKEQKLEQGGLVDQHILHCQKQKMVRVQGQGNWKGWGLQSPSGGWNDPL